MATGFRRNYNNPTTLGIDYDAYFTDPKVTYGKNKTGENFSYGAPLSNREEGNNKQSETSNAILADPFSMQEVPTFDVDPTSPEYKNTIGHMGYNPATRKWEENEKGFLLDRIAPDYSNMITNTMMYGTPNADTSKFTPDALDRIEANRQGVAATALQIAHDNPTASVEDQQRALHASRTGFDPYTGEMIQETDPFQHHENMLALHAKHNPPPSMSGGSGSSPAWRTGTTTGVWPPNAAANLDSVLDAGRMTAINTGMWPDSNVSVGNPMAGADNTYVDGYTSMYPSNLQTWNPVNDNSHVAEAALDYDTSVAGHTTDSGGKG
tara:strand:- start:14582 stop:15550 length:969 start_codon:yes stop_codon:yes gene_type:complete